MAAGIYDENITLSDGVKLYGGFAGGGILDGNGDQVARVDIGADESDGCGWYAVTFSSNRAYGYVGDSVVVTVRVEDWNGAHVGSGKRVTFYITGGTITHINNDPVTGSDYYGFTDSNGELTAAITRSVPGFLVMRAVANRS